ncbi:MAG: hypothetical protein IH991_21315, partial [Planctomycetes bacterium]|nr:hypothetical protein [Planctomycetota bacterium]
ALAKVLKGHDYSISELALSVDGRWLVTGSDDTTVRVWDLEAEDPSASAQVLKGHEGHIRALAFSPDAKRLVTGSQDHTARVWLLRIEDLLAVAARVVGRTLTDKERKMYGLGED